MHINQSDTLIQSKFAKPWHGHGDNDIVDILTKRKSQSNHDFMVSTLVDFLMANNYHTVKADLPTSNQSKFAPIFLSPEQTLYCPNTKKGQKPDASAEKNNQKYIFEVETEDSINDAHTKSQWELFSINAKQHKKEFIICVPKDYELLAQLRIIDLNIQASVWII